MNIVIVDDEPKIRNGLLKLLTSHEGWNVTGVFEEAKTALQFLDVHKADVMITDIKMPEISGLELIKNIRQKNNNISIIILSGYSYFSFAQRAIEFGVIRYLTKPTDPKELIAAVQSIEEKLVQELECKPDSLEPKVTNLIVLNAIQYIEKNYKNKIALKNMAEELFITPNYLCELFKKHTGKNLSQYINKYRGDKAKMYLAQLEYRVTDVADLVGFRNAKYFSSTFKKLYGITPLEYRNSKNPN
ncbi:MAG: AraC family transcriptional regulator [Clostridia bacterium BRH_c25]|nr:MAG: AraC family transcriptional regulator [Clostridia bacterium BRH_c25]